MSVTQIHNLKPASLIEKSLCKKQGSLSSTGAMVINTGKFTGRSPKDRFIVEDEITRDRVDWGKVNQAITPENYDKVYSKTLRFYERSKEIYVRDAYVCANPNYRVNLRIHTEFPWQNLFAFNMFLRPTEKDLSNFTAEWDVYAFPSVKADPEVDGTRQENFSIINFSQKTILIGGTAYTGEIKKGVFSALNFILPTEHDVFPMHCSANVGEDGDTALFFGLSGTGKTTLSNDPERRLIGDDEHGWSKESVFNFEGGCYAKTIDLSATKEPQIYKAIKFGALLENVGLENDGCTINYSDTSLTQNTRVSYPIYHIDNIMFNSRGDIPENIFFLTCDAFGVLPPISRLNTDQAMYHFISGYTAKISGTEIGINEPETTFSACFGAPFLPLRATEYGSLLGKKLKTGSRRGNGNINVWLINTGWTGGKYGIGSRIELTHTRAMIKAALSGALNEVEFEKHEIFKVEMPKTCPDVPNAILNPRNTWPNETEYDEVAFELAAKFIANFERYEEKAEIDLEKASPRLREVLEV